MLTTAFTILPVLFFELSYRDVVGEFGGITSSKSREVFPATFQPAAGSPCLLSMGYLRHSVETLFRMRLGRGCSVPEVGLGKHYGCVGWYDEDGTLMFAGSMLPEIRYPLGAITADGVPAGCRVGRHRGTAITLSEHVPSQQAGVGGGGGNEWRYYLKRNEDI